MVDWNFDANDVQEGFPLIPAGDHRVRISSATEKKSKGGNDMIELVLDVSGHPGSLFYYLVFLPNNKTMTNTNLKRLWDSFGIQTGNLNSSSWVGKVGAARVKHEEYNGDPQARVSYFIDKSKQDKLPPWVEKTIKASGSGLPDWAADADAAPFTMEDLDF